TGKSFSQGPSDDTSVSTRLQGKSTCGRVFLAGQGRLRRRGELGIADRGERVVARALEPLPMVDDLAKQAVPAARELHQPATSGVLLGPSSPPEHPLEPRAVDRRIDPERVRALLVEEPFVEPLEESRGGICSVLRDDPGGPG